MADILQGRRSGGYVVFLDTDGLRHAVRGSAVLAASDADEAQDATVLQLPGGRVVRILEPLDRVLAWLWP